MGSTQFGNFHVSFQTVANIQLEKLSLTDPVVRISAGTRHYRSAMYVPQLALKSLPLESTTEHVNRG